MSSGNPTLAYTRQAGFAKGWFKASLGPLAVAWAMAIWFIALDEVDLTGMTDVGLISVLPVSIFAAIAALSVSYFVSLRAEPPRAWLMLLHIGALIVMLYGITALIQDVPRFESAWKHVGMTEYILRNGSIDPSIDAYHNWPGFFILTAFLTDIAGFNTAIVFLAWAPVVYNLLYLGPLFMIFSRVSTDARLPWLAVWIFYITNWIGQDYFSPQGFSYFIYLAMLAVLLTWFTVPSGQRHPAVKVATWVRLPIGWIDRLLRWMAPADAPGPPLLRWQRAALMLFLIAAFAAVVPSHQLSPVAMLGSVAALVICNRCTFRTLPVVMAGMILLWLTSKASGYMAGHTEHVAGQVGAVGASVGANMGDRLAGSPGHMVVVYLRTGMAAVLWALAGLGGLRRLRNGHRDFTYAILALTPFPLVVAQPYGGEMLLRVYLFSLPFMAFFAAALFFAAPGVGRTWLTTAMVTLVSLALVGSFFVTRYGNERMDYFTPAEADAVSYLYDVAPSESLLMAGTVKTPWRYRDYEKYRYRTLADHVEYTTGTADEFVNNVANVMRSDKYPAAFLLITRSQLANDELFHLLPVPLAQIEQALLGSDQFQVVFTNEDAKIFMLTADATTGGGQ